AVLQECAAAWNRTFSGWTAGGDCLLAETVGCDAEGKIDSLNFSGLDLNGTIPTSIATLTTLTHFDITTNNFAGTSPLSSHASPSSETWALLKPGFRDPFPPPSRLSRTSRS
ncbi:unnamed protein product, partial [Closterium sp. Naga37s-1]